MTSPEYVNGQLNYVNSLPGLNTSVDFKQGNWIRYSLPGWYIWSSNYDPGKRNHTKKLDLFRDHSGFDSAGMVTDIRNVQDFIREN